jgi:hydroxymethylpyrimidine pyrophosphatase-like HAD family hydrolase
LHDNRAWFGPGVTEEKILGIRALRSFIDSEILPREPKAIMQFGKEAQISVFSEHPEIFGGIQARVEAFVEERGGPELLINASHYYLNISLTGVNKGNALGALLEELGVTREETAGIGDTEGDLPLRESVGFFACPANATQPVKDAADYVSPYPDIAGMLDILKRPELEHLPKG